ncbi:MAG: gamma-glutamyl-gamma-aminobutyrate hydrolase family protein [Gemmatimonadota bacterium]|nr:gamma-glutamyl-gamma-aminobutyrate hydrolase family protein [Gemmatimonadota bacterium]
MSRPVIGITTSIETSEGRDCRQVVGRAYISAVERAGGCPVILPMVERREALAPVLDLIDGLIITGGPGVTDGLIGSLPEDLPPVDPVRSQTDDWFFHGARKRDLPMLGICYGMQFINTRFDGAIYADLQAQLGKCAHSPKRSEQRPVRHRVRTLADTWLAGLTGRPGDALDVNSSHIQAIEGPGNGLRVNAVSDDGVIEGIETEDGRIIGVQFHPEALPGTVWDRIFEHLVSIARAGRNRETVDRD